MRVPTLFAGLFISASAAFLSAPAAVATPASGTATLGQADVAPVVQVQYRHRYRHGSRGYGYGSYATDFRRRGCIHGTPSETSAYPSSMVCHRR
jgi:hypothetical protein